MASRPDSPPPHTSGGIAFRPVDCGDHPFLLVLQIEVLRADLGLGALPPEELERLARMQFEGQRASYRVEFPGADYLLVLWNGDPIGQLILNRTSEEIYGVDILLLPALRRHGIGTRVLRLIQEEAKAGRKPFRFQVRKGNRAIELYSRLGFLLIRESDTHFLMEWDPTSD